MSSVPPFTFERLTPPGRGAIAVIELVPLSEAADLSAVIDSHFDAASGKPFASNRRDMVYGVWRSTGEDLIVVRGEPGRLEIQCHGSVAVIDQICADLEAAGGRRHEHSSASRNDDPIPNEPDDLFESVREEIEGLVKNATTQRVATILLQQWHRLPAAMAEVARLRQSQQPEPSATAARELLRHADFGDCFHRTRRVVLCGPVNAGKSSLLNAILGFDRVIVNAMPGTTRDVITHQSAVDGWPVTFSDTAGLRETDQPIEQAGIAMARKRIAQADVIVGVADVSRWEESRQHLRSLERVDLLVLNKADLVSPVQQSEMIERASCDFAGCPRIFTSIVAVADDSSSGTGIGELLGELGIALTPTIPPADAVFPLTARQREWLRIQSNQASG